jgi:hypothetical protein
MRKMAELSYLKTILYHACQSNWPVELSLKKMRNRMTADRRDMDLYYRVPLLCRNVHGSIAFTILSQGLIKNPEKLIVGFANGLKSRFHTALKPPSLFFCTCRIDQRQLAVSKNK